MPSLWLHCTGIRAASSFHLTRHLDLVMTVRELGTKLKVNFGLSDPGPKSYLERRGISTVESDFFKLLPINAEQFCESFNIDMNVPYKDLPEETKDLLLYGSGDKEFTLFIPICQVR